MVLNPEKSHFMRLGKDIDDTETLNFDDLLLKNSKKVEILRITLDRSMDFNTHIKSICRQADQKLSAQLRISPYLDQGKKILLYKSMIKSQFNYCPIVWMYYSRQSNNLINKVDVRGLRVTHRNESNKKFQQILRESNQPTIYQKHLHVLITEVYKTVSRNRFLNFALTSLNFQEIFRKTVKYGIATVTYQAPLLWPNLQSE